MAPSHAVGSVGPRGQAGANRVGPEPERRADQWGRGEQLEPRLKPTGRPALHCLGMDESAYHASRHHLNPTPCVFERAILAGCAVCELARRRALAEREVLTCTVPVARINCATLLDLLHERARFALRLPRAGEPIAHAKMMQLQCGGLRGVQAAMDAPVADVHAVVRQAQGDGASLLELPWDGIVTAIVAWRSRRRNPGPRP